MADKKNLSSLKVSLEESIKKVVDNLDKKPKDINDFLDTKTIGLTIELYPEDENYDCDKVLKAIVERCTELDCLYAYCLHDNDFFSENTFDSNKRLIGRKGQKKKNHYHVVIMFNYPTVIGDFMLSIGFSQIRFVKKLKKPLEVDNMILYLSHIKYPNKHQYHNNGDVTGYIESNRFDYCNYLHLTYHPKSAIKYAIKLSQENTHRYIRKEDVFLACDEAEIGYDDYLKAYRVVKDIIDEHNRELEIISPNLEKAYVRQMSEMNKKEESLKKSDKAIRELAETFGSIRVEFDGKEMMVVNIPDKKRLFDKPLEDEKTIDMLKENRKKWK